jgi:hypothetical protein
VFGVAVARARNIWWKTLEMREERADEGLFSTASVIRPDPKVVEKDAIPAMAANIGKLLNHLRAQFMLVDHTLEIFGEYYGQVTESCAPPATPTSPRPARSCAGSPPAAAGTPPAPRRAPACCTSGRRRAWPNTGWLWRKFTPEDSGTSAGQRHQPEVELQQPPRGVARSSRPGSGVRCACGAG